MSDIHIHVGGKSPVEDKPKSETGATGNRGNAHNAEASGIKKGPQTQLSPLEEALFPQWMRANGVEPDGTEDHAYDYRGAYKSSNGAVHPPGTLLKVADRFNKIQEGQPEPIRDLLNMFHGSNS